MWRRAKFGREILVLFAIMQCFLANNGFTQVDSNHQIEFVAPVKIPISLAGNFGELRPGHFHAGLDIRTQGRENIPIYAIADGYVSRVAVSLSGYGKVIYVNHPNGYTSVYAHLNSFYPSIDSLVEEIQYQNKTFVFDTVLNPNQFMVKQNQQIALSGNTGGSGGPHLHFEIRNTQSETPINPLHFGLNITDNIAPTLRYLSIYPLSANSSVNNKSEVQTFKLNKSAGRYVLANGSMPQVKGKIGFGLETRDHFNGSNFRCGVYSIKLKKDGKTVYSHKMDSIAYSETRCINAHMDYHQAKKFKRRTQRSFLLDGNYLSIYDSLVNNGYLFFMDSAIHKMQYWVTDYKGNQSELTFKVKANQQLNSPKTETNNAVMPLVFNQENDYADSNLRIHFSKTCLYENTPLVLKTQPKIGRCVTPRYHINSLYQPLHDYMDLSINIKHIPPSDRNKLVIVSLTNKSEILAAEGGTVDSNWITVKTRSFGPYTVMKDEIAPQMRFATNPSGKTYRTNSTITFGLTDNISGISKYEAFIDGQWQLIEYQKNKKRAFLTFNKVKPNGGKRVLKIEITDKVGNKSVKEFSIIY